MERRRREAKQASAAATPGEGEGRVPGFRRGPASSETAAQAGHAKRQTLAKVENIVSDAAAAEEPAEDTRRRGRRGVVRDS